MKRYALIGGIPVKSENGEFVKWEDVEYLVEDLWSRILISREDVFDDLGVILDIVYDAKESK